MNDYYIYILLDSSKKKGYIYDDLKLDYEPFYVGKGRKDRINYTLYDKAPFKRNKINKLKKSNIEIISKKIKINLSNEESNILEKHFINKIGRRDLKKGPLVNTTDGGDGRLSSSPTQETRDKISKALLSKNYKWNHTQETLKKMSKIQKGTSNGFYGKTHSDKNKKKQSKLVSGIKHPMYGKAHNIDTIKKLKKHRCENISNDNIKESCQKFNKPILMYDLNLNFLKEFKSVKKASEETKINESIISKCCRGDIKKPTRFYFKYKNKDDKIKNNKYVLSIGEEFTINYKTYKLVKRNKKTSICKYNDQLYTFHHNDYQFLIEKDTNNSDITELYLFIKNIDNSFKIKDNIIYNKNIKIQYMKLFNNCELFVNKNSLLQSNSDIIIFSDEWRDKKDIVKSRINYLLSNTQKIWARKCKIKEVKDNRLIREFLTKNHIQGFVGSKIKIGLYYNDELVSIMTFGNLRKNMGSNSKKDNYELLRFCNKLNTTVVGGASKLFRYFLNNYNPTSILSYADLRWSKGDLYKQLGFDFISNTVPNYYWIINDNREYRFRWRKDILVSKGYDPNMTEIQIMNSLNRYRIFDKGNMKFLYLIN